MKKTYQFLVVLAAMLLGATNVSAERIPLTADGFFTHDGWGAQAVKTGDFQAEYHIGEVSGCAFGDPDCAAYLDLGAYSKLYVNMAGCNKTGDFDGSTPRIFFNSDKSRTEEKTSDTHLIVPQTAGYSTQEEDGTIVVDLNKIKKEYGCVYLTAIKGSAWDTQVLLTSIEVEKDENAQQVGWVSIINNGDFATDDLESFPLALHAFTGDDGKADYRPTIVTDPETGARYIQITSDADAKETWSTQFFIKFNEKLPVGSQWRMSFDAKADVVANVTTSSHNLPRQWHAGGPIDAFDIPVDWQPFSFTGTVTSNQLGTEGNEDYGFQSIAFDLNNDKVNANNFYFRNFRMEQLKSGAMASFGGIAIVMDFGFATNVADLVKAAKVNRLLFPNECAKVKVNGQPVEVLSVEGWADGRFIIFVPEMFDSTDKVEVEFSNPGGDLELKYTAGPTPGAIVANGKADAVYKDEMSSADDLIPYIMVNPVVKSANPQQGSFRVDPNLKEFLVTFDKKADVSKAVATLDGQALTVAAVNPDENGFSADIKLTYSGSAMANGIHTINLSKIYPEFLIYEEIYADTTYSFSVGPVDVTDLPTDVLPIDYFNNCAGNYVPEGFLLIADNQEERTPGNNYGSGARMMEFSAGGDFTRGLYMRSWYLTYGANDEEHVLALKAGKTYNISFNSAMWTNSAAKYMKFQIKNGDEEVFSKVVENGPGLGESRNAVKGSTFTSIDFTPTVDANYVMNWIVANDAEGTPTDNGWNNGVILANVKVTYIPATYGANDLYNLAEALKKAKEKQELNADERYAGAAQTDLNNAIAKVEAEQDTYTNPSQCEEATELLAQTASALVDHVALCKSYDDIISKGADVVDQNKEKKFAVLETFAELKAIVDKYHATSTMTNTGTEEEPVWQRIREFDKLTDDTELQAAIDELNGIVNKTSLMFTEGVSETGNTGVKVLVDRLRRGAETMKKLDAENPIIEEALNAFEDDDELAEKVKNNIKAALYKKILENDPTLFAEDEATGLKDSYDMSVFFKNPNVYAFHLSDGCTPENVPGWDVVGATGEITHMWSGGTHDIKGIPDDVSFTRNHTAVRYEQTVTDLPAGIYTVILDATCWEWNSDGTKPDCTDAYAFAKNGDALLAGGEGEDEQFSGKFDLDNYGQYSGHHDCEMSDIVVTDGILNLGANFGPNSQFMFDKIVAVNLTAPANADYTSLYNEVKTGIDAAPAAAKVRAIELYDLNGQRIPVAKKGVVIVKKHMSDGTVKMEKVIK